MSARHLVFAFGSNLSRQQMSERCPAHEIVGNARLLGYGLDFPVYSTKRKGGGASIIPTTADDAVYGVVYSLNDQDLASLDGFEAIARGLYRREFVTVELTLDGSQLAVEAYIGNPQDGAPFPPSTAYMDVIISGAIENGLPAAYIAKLQAIACNDSAAA